MAGMKVITDGLNKRDEVRYSELLKIRNAEVKAYSQAIGEAFGKINILTVVIINDKNGVV